MIAACAFSPAAGRAAGRALALRLAPLLLLVPLPAAGQTLFDNLQGIALGADGAVHRFAAMVVSEEGRVVELLDKGEAPQIRARFRQDMGGRVVAPGFVDAHARLVPLGLSTMVLDLGAAASLADALAMVADFAANNPQRPWILGRGWDEDRWAQAGAPDAAGSRPPARLPQAGDLDLVVGDRPVWLVREDGEAGWANSVALFAAGIAAGTPDPAGGRIVREGRAKRATGILTGTAMALVDKVIPPPLPEDREAALFAAQGLLLASGITALADMGTSIEDWMTFRRAGDAGWLRIRIMAYADTVATMLLVGGSGPTPWLYDDRLRLGGLRLEADGALGARTALLKEEYADAPGYRGLARLDGTQLRNLASRAALGRFQVAIGATGDAATREALLTIAELAPDYPGDRRWRIERAALVDPADIALFGEHGIVASMQPARQPADERIRRARLGPSRSAGGEGGEGGAGAPLLSHPWGSLSRAGAGLAFGSGAPEAPLAPLAALALAIGRDQREGEALGIEQALAAHTLGGAHAGFAEGRFGRLAPGEWADFVVLEVDPLAATAQDLLQAEVLQTFVAGRLAHEHGPRAIACAPGPCGQGAGGADSPP